MPELRDDDIWWFNRHRNRINSFVNEKKRKRTERQLKYRMSRQRRLEVRYIGAD